MPLTLGLIFGVNKNPELAASVARVYGQVHLEWRKDRKQAQTQRAAEAVKAQLGEYPPAVQ